MKKTEHAKHLLAIVFLIVIFFVCVSYSYGDVPVPYGQRINANIKAETGETWIKWTWNESAFDNPPNVYVDGEYKENASKIYYQFSLTPKSLHVLSLIGTYNNTISYDMLETKTESRLISGIEDYLAIYIFSLVLLVIGYVIPLMCIPSLALCVYSGILALKETTESIIILTIWITAILILIVFAYLSRR